MRAGKPPGPNAHEVQTGRQPAQLRSDDNVFELTRDELDTLPFGVVTLTREGRILRYNQAERALSRRDERTTIGLDFFTEVAPCTNVAAFRARFDEFARRFDAGIEHFDFTFNFRWGLHAVSITLLRKAGHADINILVRGRATPAPSKLVRFERGSIAQPAARIPVMPCADGADVRSQPLLYRHGDAEELDLRSRIHRDDAARVAAAIAAAARNRAPYAVEYRLERSGHHAIIEETGFFPDAMDVPGYAMIMDVSERRKREDEYRRAAHYDGLTGLPNQNLFLQRIGAALAGARANGQRVAVLVSNIDKFRETNDMFGREIGNELLAMLALRLGECIRDGDTVARLGGDWFAVLLTDVASRADADQIVRRLTASMAQPFLIDERSHHLTLSIGIALGPDDSADRHRLLRAAYTAMSTAKAAGPNEVCWYSAEMSVRAAENARRRNELHAALDNTELELHYQAIVDLAQERVVAVESLVRWNHPSRGLLLPAEFIGLADKSGLIVSLGEWVLREACRQARIWVDGGFDLCMCVNVSAVQFRQPNFVALVADILAQNDLPADRLQLELTESIMVDGFAQMMETLGQLKASGLRIAVDDFGTGYSSLAYLKYFPVDTLKIDRAFVIDIAVDEFDRAIATTVLTLAKELGLNCVVEGVETRDQLDVLLSIGCTTMQGFYFSKPMPADQLHHTLIAWKTRTASSDQ
jgi:photoactive yellow protein